MIILAIETATTAVGVAIAADEGPQASFTLSGAGHQAETLHPAVETLLASSGVALGDIDAVVVDVGPGLFTGLRVGIAAAKAFGLGLGVPLVGVESTAVLGRAAALHRGEVLAVVDLRRGDLGFAWRASYAPGAPLPAPEAAQLTSIDALGEMLSGRPSLAEVLIVGDGALRHRPRLEEAYGGALPLAGRELATPSASLLAEIGLAQLAAGEAVEALALEAHYLKGADVRINFAIRPEAASATMPATPEVMVRR